MNQNRCRSPVPAVVLGQFAERRGLREKLHAQRCRHPRHCNKVSFIYLRNLPYFDLGLSPLALFLFFKK